MNSTTNRAKSAIPNKVFSNIQHELTRTHFQLGNNCKFNLDKYFYI